MRVEDLKRWHWVLIAILVGAAMSYIRLGTVDAMGEGRSSSLWQFEQKLRQPPVKGHAWLRNIVVYPPLQSGISQMGRDGKPHFPIKRRVTFDLLEPLRDGSGMAYRSYQLYVDDPYTRPINGMRLGEPKGTVLDRLAEAKAANGVQYRYAWWMVPKWSYVLWIGGCVVAIGGVWPTLLNLLIGAGWGRPPQEKEAPKRAYSSTPEPVENAKRSPSDFSQEDLNRLDEMEKDLAGFMQNNQDQDIEQENQEAEIRVLNAGPLESATGQQGEEQPKSYAGEFYPTIAHAPKNSEEKKE